MKRFDDFVDTLKDSITETNNEDLSLEEVFAREAEELNLVRFENSNIEMLTL